MSVILLKSGGPESMPEWKAAFAEAAPELQVAYWDDPVPPEDVRYVMVWDPDPGRLAQLPGLRVVFSSAAGVDNITRDPAWPRHLPLVRMGGDNTAQRMGEYISWACLSLLRGGRRIALAQAESQWRNFESRFSAPERRVGIMGLGNLGTRTAEMLRGLGFPVSGWSRSRKSLPGVTSFAGDAELEAFLAQTDILVCLLPSTPETVQLISAPLLQKLPAGAGLVNAGRGSHASIPDIIAALDSGQLSGAVLDVFEQEPLPADNPVWTHPKIVVTPHLASLAPRHERARYVADAIRAHEEGAAMPNLFDPEKGY